MTIIHTLADTGAQPKASNTVKVHYRALADGKEFDNSIKRGLPTSFPLNRVEPFGTEGPKAWEAYLFEINGWRQWQTVKGVF